MNQYTIAILIDAENVSASHIEYILGTAERQGRLVIRTVFGDFSENRLSAWVDAAGRYGLDLHFQLSTGKNSADIAMTIAALDILHARAASGICIASSDRDFIPLARRLVAGGLAVYGICKPQARPTLEPAFTRCFDLPIANTASNIVEAKPVADRGDESWLAETIRTAPNYNPRSGINLAVAAQRIRDSNPRLAEKHFGKGKFLKNLSRFDVVETLPIDGSMHVRLREGKNMLPA